MKRYLWMLLTVLLLAGCKQEYGMEVERLEMYNGHFNGIDRDYKTIEARNDEEAAEEAFLRYMVSIKTAHTMKGESFYWIPIDYTLEDNKHHRVASLTPEKKKEVGRYILSPEVKDWYREMLGMDVIGTPLFEMIER